MSLQNHHDFIKRLVDMRLSSHPSISSETIANAIILLSIRDDFPISMISSPRDVIYIAYKHLDEPTETFMVDKLLFLRTGGWKDDSAAANRIKKGWSGAV